VLVDDRSLVVLDSLPAATVAQPSGRALTSQMFRPSLGFSLRRRNHWLYRGSPELT